jgi:RimJ/RimL family protein N-acetyltransferase
VAVSKGSNRGPLDASFRLATVGDVDNILDVQQPGAVRGLGHIFPQERYPFPREAIAERWRREIADPGIAAYVSTDDHGRITGFAVRREDEFLHFGTAVEMWGTGLAGWLHDQVLATYPRSLRRIRLRVLVENQRARRFYEKCGWTETDVRSTTQFPPHPVLMEYALLRDP